jgi:1,4-alpha-glucan branching enzyme
MGGEFGQKTEWDHDGQLDWDLLNIPSHDSLRRYIGDLNRLYRDYSALYELDCSADGFSWVDADDADRSIFSFCRFARNGETILVVLNFTPVPQYDYRVGVPHAGKFVELLNSDAEIYGGSNIGNLGDIAVQDESQHGRPNSVVVNVPPLGMLVLKHFEGQN